MAPLPALPPAALKCPCDGSRATLTDKLEAAVARKREMLMQAGATGSCGGKGSKGPSPVRLGAKEAGDAGSGDKEDEGDAVDSGINGWAHLRDASHSPDSVWRGVPAHTR